MPNFDEFNLESLGGKKLHDIQLSEEAEKDAEFRVGKIEDQGADKVAELAFLTRAEIFDMLHAEMKKSVELQPAEAANPGKKEQYEQAFQTLLQKKSFQMKIAYYKKLLAKANVTLQKGLKYHGQEKRELNGNYLGYKKLLGQQLKLEKQLEEVMAGLFAERGHDPDSMLVETRQLLEEGLDEVKGSIDKLKNENPDTAAYLEYEKIKKYSEELENGFAWTESRKKIVDEALKRAMASRPLIVLMGESGVGKTALARALSKKLTGMEPEREVGGKDYRLRDLLGARAIDEQGDYLKFGPLLRAMTGMESSRDKKPKNEGGIYFDDEFNTRPVEVQRQILKFVAEAKPGQKVTVPGTEIKVTVQPKFLYLAAGNPNSARYDREETPVEAYREFSGVLDVDYLKQNKDEPELMEVMVAALMDQKTRRLRVVSEEEIMPDYLERGGKLVLDQVTAMGGFLWRFAEAWKGLLDAFAHHENLLHQRNPAQPKEKYYLQKFVLDLGKVRDWLHQYKISGNDQKLGIEAYIKNKLDEELQSYPAEDQVIVKEMMKNFGIDLGGEGVSLMSALGKLKAEAFTIMTPKEIGYLFPNVPRPKIEGRPKPQEAPEPGKIAILDDGTEVAYEEKLPQGLVHIGKVGDEIKHNQINKIFKLLGQTEKGEIVLEANNQYSIWSFNDVQQNFQPALTRQPSSLGEFRNHIKTLPLTVKQQEKLNVMMVGYHKSVAAAKEVDSAVQIKPIGEIITAFLQLGPDKLKEIAEFGQPTLIITPKNSFADKMVNMNSNKKYVDANGRLNTLILTQADTFVSGDVHGPYKNIGTPTKTVVSVVDGQPHVQPIPGIPPDSRYDLTKSIFKAGFAQKGMRLINIHEAAVLEQLSLRDYKANNYDVSKIVDYYQAGRGDTSCLDDEYLTNSSDIAYSCFNAELRNVSFNVGAPDAAYGSLRARPSVPFLEYSDEKIEHEELLKNLGTSYEKMVSTLTDFGFNGAPPSKTQVMDAIEKLDPEKLKEIAKFGKPTVLITLKNDFASKVQAINDHKKMPGQRDMDCNPESDDRLWGDWWGAPTKIVVTVVDGLDAMPQPSFITRDLSVGEKMDTYEREFAKQNLDIMSCQEGAMLMMQSLNRGQPIDDVNSTHTVTYFDRKNLIKGRLGDYLPYGFWNSHHHKVDFRIFSPHLKHDDLRCRPSVKVLEI